MYEMKAVQHGTVWNESYGIDTGKRNSHAVPDWKTYKFLYSFISVDWTTFSCLVQVCRLDFHRDLTIPVISLLRHGPPSFNYRRFCCYEGYSESKLRWGTYRTGEYVFACLCQRRLPPVISATFWHLPSAHYCWSTMIWTSSSGR
jgi:hypothetical protein